MPLTRWVHDQIDKKADPKVVEVILRMNDRINAVHEANKGLTDAYSKLVEMFEKMVQVNTKLKDSLEATQKKLGVRVESEDHENEQGLRHPQLPPG